MQDDFSTTRNPRIDETAAPGDPVTVVALFDTLPEAERALDALLAEGYHRDRISLVASNATGEYDSYARRDERDDVVDSDDMDAGEGAAVAGGIGAAIGGVGGVLMGLGLLAIPGIGPALAAGPLISGLVGAGIGAAAGSITGALVNAGVPEDRAGEYAEGVRRGGTLVTLETTASGVARAEDILVEHGSIDIDERSSHWRDAGWERFDERAEPYSPEAIEAERARYGVKSYREPSGGTRR
jgi:hypothetical protein